MPLISWIKRNKLVTVLLIVLVYLLFSSRIMPLIRMSPVPITESLDYASGVESAPFGAISGPSLDIMNKLAPTGREAAPQANVDDRLVIEESSLSLLVKDVTEIRNKIISYAEGNGGYMVSTSLSNPQDTPSGSVVIRIPVAERDETLAYLRGLAVKVVSERLTGRDVTDTYIDIEKRIELHMKTLARFEEILTQAQEISDITSLNQQIIQIQNQIDTLRGQQEALSQNAQLMKLTIHLGTDEIALPYAPSDTFRPQVIFKLAVRSLVGRVRNLATLFIWVIVYSVLWLPIVAAIYWWRRRRKQVG